MASKTKAMKETEVDPEIRASDGEF
jgi:hypothetical protein